MLNNIVKQLNSVVSEKLSKLTLDDYLYGDGGFPHSSLKRVKELQVSIKYIEDFKLSMLG